MAHEQRPAMPHARGHQPAAAAGRLRRVGRPGAAAPRWRPSAPAAALVGAGQRRSARWRRAARHAQEQGRLANENPPRLRTHDRYGHRVDEVEFHPAWHDLMTTAIGHGLHAAPWRQPATRRAPGPRRQASTSGARPRPATCARSR